MYSNWIGIVNQAAMADPEKRENPYEALEPSVTLKTEKRDAPYFREAEEAFGKGRWIDWGSELYSGTYEQMCRFLDLVEATEESRSAIDAMPRDAVFGYEWMEHVWGSGY